MTSLSRVYQMAMRSGNVQISCHCFERTSTRSTLSAKNEQSTVRINPNVMQPSNDDGEGSKSLTRGFKFPKCLDQGRGDREEMKAVLMAQHLRIYGSQKLVDILGTRKSFGQLSLGTRVRVLQSPTLCLIILPLGRSQLTDTANPGYGERLKSPGKAHVTELASMSRALVFMCMLEELLVGAVIVKVGSGDAASRKESIGALDGREQSRSDTGGPDDTDTDTGTGTEHVESDVGGEFGTSRRFRQK